MKSRIGPVASSRGNAFDAFLLVSGSWWQSLAFPGFNSIPPTFVTTLHGVLSVSECLLLSF
jgi:hypothetical protein